MTLLISLGSYHSIEGDSHGVLKRIEGTFLFVKCLSMADHHRDCLGRSTKDLLLILHIYSDTVCMKEMNSASH